MAYFVVLPEAFIVPFSTALSTLSAVFSALSRIVSATFDALASTLSATASALATTLSPASVCLLHAPSASTPRPIAAALIMSFINFPLYRHPHKRTPQRMAAEASRGAPRDREGLNRIGNRSAKVK